MIYNPYDQAAFAQYTPMSSQEILQPALLMKERHDKLDEEYAAIDNELQKVAFAANMEGDQEIMNRYNNYQNSLTTARDELMSNGVNTQNKRKMLNLRSKFQSEIQPISQAFEIKSKMVAQNQEMRAKDPTYIGQDPSTVKLSDIMNNGMQPIAMNGMSGALLTQMVAEQVKPFSQKLSHSPGELKALLSTLVGEEQVPIYFDYINRYGYTPGTQGYQIILDAAKQKIYQSTNMQNWGLDENQLSQAEGWMNQGATAMIGQDKNQVLDNPMLKYYIAKASENDSIIEPTLNHISQDRLGASGVKDNWDKVLPGASSEEEVDVFVNSLYNSDAGVSSSLININNKKAIKLQNEESTWGQEIGKVAPGSGFGSTGLSSAFAAYNLFNVVAPTNDKKANKLYKKNDEIINKIGELSDKYGYLSPNPNDPVEGIKKGIKLEKEQSKQVDKEYNYNMKPGSSLTHALKQRTNQLKDVDTKGLYEIDTKAKNNKGSKIGKKEIEALKNDDFSIVFTEEFGNVIQINGKEYLTDDLGIDSFNEGNKMIKSVSKYIRDFSAPSTKIDSEPTVLYHTNVGTIYGQNFRDNSGNITKAVFVEYPDPKNPASVKRISVITDLNDQLEGGFALRQELDKLTSTIMQITTLNNEFSLERSTTRTQGKPVNTE